MSCVFLFCKDTDTQIAKKKKTCTERVTNPTSSNRPKCQYKPDQMIVCGWQENQVKTDLCTTMEKKEGRKKKCQQVYSTYLKGRHPCRLSIWPPDPAQMRACLYWPRRWPDICGDRICNQYWEVRWMKAATSEGTIWRTQIRTSRTAECITQITATTTTGHRTCPVTTHTKFALAKCLDGLRPSCLQIGRQITLIHELQFT